jgi:NAD(P)-dependent dehydrogenase (short-subunit alcohol dehydrogenase family)
MVEQGFGRIIFVSSESGLNIPAELVHYGMTKDGAARRLARHCRSGAPPACDAW